MRPILEVLTENILRAQATSLTIIPPFSTSSKYLNRQTRLIHRDSTFSPRLTAQPLRAITRDAISEIFGKFSTRDKGSRAQLWSEDPYNRRWAVPRDCQSVLRMPDLEAEISGSELKQGRARTRAGRSPGSGGCSSGGGSSAAFTSSPQPRHVQREKGFVEGMNFTVPCTRGREKPSLSFYSILSASSIDLARCPLPERGHEELMYSSFEWLIPLTLGTKIVSRQVMQAMGFASWDAPLMDTGAHLLHMPSPDLPDEGQGQLHLSRSPDLWKQIFSSGKDPEL